MSPRTICDEELKEICRAYGRMGFEDTTPMRRVTDRLPKPKNSATPQKFRYTTIVAVAVFSFAAGAMAHALLTAWH